MKLFYQGGMGNQLFQFAFGKYLQKKGFNIEFSTSLLDVHNSSLTPRSYELKSFNEAATSSKFDLAAAYIYRNILVRSKSLLVEEYPAQESENLITKKTKFLLGYFQSNRYADAIWNEEKSKFNALLERPRGLPASYIAVHLRFNDYKQKENLKIFGEFSLNYLKEAITRIDASKQKTIVVVTDSILDATRVLNGESIGEFNIVYRQTDTLQDFNILVHSDITIITNSSYSWWSGYLGNRLFNNKIFAPYPWYVNGWQTHIDFYPKEWELIERK